MNESNMLHNIPKGMLFLHLYYFFNMSNWSRVWIKADLQIKFNLNHSHCLATHLVHTRKIKIKPDTVITSFSGCKRDWNIINIVWRVLSWTLSSDISACCTKKKNVCKISRTKLIAQHYKIAFHFFGQNYPLCFGLIKIKSTNFLFFFLLIGNEKLY